MRRRQRGVKTERPSAGVSDEMLFRDADATGHALSWTGHGLWRAAPISVDFLVK